MANKEKMEFYRGRTYSRDFTIIGWSKEIDQLYFTVKSNVEDKDYILQKSLNDGITLVDKTTDDDGNVLSATYNLLIDATDTDDLDINKNFEFDIAIISGNIKETAITGTIKLNGTSTMTQNEKEG